MKKVISTFALLTLAAQCYGYTTARCRDTWTGNTVTLYCCHVSTVVLNNGDTIAWSQPKCGDYPESFSPSSLCTPETFVSISDFFGGLRIEALNELCHQTPHKAAGCSCDFDPD